MAVTTMRRVALVVAVLAGAVTPLRGQRAHQLELGASVSATRYDHLMGLPDHVGILGHVGYLLSRGVAIEVAGGFSQPQTSIPFEFTTVRWASASVVLNIPAGSRNLPYLLGGYTRIQLRSPL